jgi:hypothetical protein
MKEPANKTKLATAMEPLMEPPTHSERKYPNTALNNPCSKMYSVMRFKLSVIKYAVAAGTTRKAITKIAPTLSKLTTVATLVAAIKV